MSTRASASRIARNRGTGRADLRDRHEGRDNGRILDTEPGIRSLCHRQSPRPSSNTGPRHRSCHGTLAHRSVEEEQPRDPNRTTRRRTCPRRLVSLHPPDVAHPVRSSILIEARDKGPRPRLNLRACLSSPTTGSTSRSREGAAGGRRSPDSPYPRAPVPRKHHYPLADALAARGNRVILIDLLGHGESDKPSTRATTRWSYSGDR